ncbi:HipA domain-containing protein [Candidatus Poriferisodalis sp.]|uniref:HipA domain-containing protein n=1 Tax=Candidatus Poriferisodalis sp. TaxID=3101277 RepID=UPI003B01EBDF
MPKSSAMNAPEPLTVHICGKPAGVLDHHRGELRFAYSDDYAADPAAVPLSVSMPLTGPPVVGRRISGWLDGLLPTNQLVRRRWAARHGALSHSAFDVLGTAVGLDLPGAVQTFSYGAAAGLHERPSGIDWLSTAQLEGFVDQLVREKNWRREGTRSAWSLAGAQSKTALVRDGDRWGEPWGTNASTHILKPSMPGLQDQAINEHLCLAAARHCGLAAARSQPLRIGSHSVIAVTRDDRPTSPNGTVARAHQEDLHQACGEPDIGIYQSDFGGHPISRFARLFAEHSAEPDTDKRRFLDALVFNWLVCNLDGHAKNYGLQLAHTGHRLAPLYDIWSMQPYEPDLISSHTMAMSALPDRRILAADNPAAWRAAAAAIGIAPAEGPLRAAALAAALAGAFTRAADELPEDVRQAPIVHTLTTAMTQRSQHCLTALAAN